MRRSTLLLPLVIACAAEREVTVAEPAPTAGAEAACVEVERLALATLDAAAEGMTDAPAALLAAIEGEWEGDTDDGRELSTTLAASGAPGWLIVSRPAAAGAEPRELEACAPRYELPLVQSLSVDGREVALAAGAWSVSRAGPLSFTATAPLLEVEGLAPVELVPAWFDTVDLSLTLSGDPDGALSLAVSWVGRRETPADATALAPGVATTTVTVSEATEPVWTVPLSRED
jgi:hypothetical protein